MSRSGDQENQDGGAEAATPVAEDPALPSFHEDVLGALDGVKLSTEHHRVGPATMSIELLGPAAERARLQVGDAAHIVRLLHWLHHRIWDTGLPSGERPGVFSEPLTQVVLETYAIELSRTGIGVPVRLPLRFTPEQARPDLPGLLLTLRLVMQPVGGRGRAQVVFLVEDPRGERDAPASATPPASVAPDGPAH